MVREKKRQASPEEHPLYHNTAVLLENYRDVVWSLELAVPKLEQDFEKEFGESINSFLDSLYLAGADFSNTKIGSHARSIDKSRKMLRLIDAAVETLRAKHKSGEVYYWILYYSYLSPQQLEDTEEILEHLRPYMQNLSRRTYYRKRQDAIEALAPVLWGYTSRECRLALESFLPTRS